MQSVVIIGSGNVATSLGMAFIQAGIRVEAVYSRNTTHAETLAAKLGTQAVKQLNDLPANAGLYLVAVKDEAIEAVAQQLKPVNGIVAHTSGSTPLSVLSMHKRCGVFYGLQTFSKNNPPELSQVPFLIEAAAEQDLQLLMQLASIFSSNVQAATTPQRQALHVAAVFANNFTNHLYVVSEALLDEHGLSFDLLKPLILKTADNILKGHPANYQTGPAVRNDRNILSLHLQLLNQHPQWREIYEVMSRSIASLQGKND
jgi:predicted short-subunit dehydrogenase-like oxidoreductase (DUF2520 family)